MASLDKNYAATYGTNVYTMAQQEGSVLRPYVTIETMKGEKRYFDRVHPTSAVRYNTKYDDTVLVHTTFDRRTIHGVEYTWADMVDWADDLNLFIDPTSNIVRMGGMAMGREIDKIIIERGFDGVAYEGKEGLTQVAFPDAQKLPITFGATSNENVGLTVDKLLEVRSRFGRADVDLDAPGNELFIAVTQAQMDDLYKGVDLRSRDYEAIRDLCEGKTRKFLGFTFVRTGLLNRTETTGGYSRTCCAWVKSGIILCLPQEISMSVDQRPDKNNNWQALAKMKAGATRIEDTKVQQVLCFEK